MVTNWTVDTLKEFEVEIAELFNIGKIRAPIHLSDGTETELIKIFNKVKTNDWVLCSWRSH